MNYTNPNLRELLAGEYVLGLLSAGAHGRFERLAVEDARLRAEVVAWEEKFSAWTLTLKPLAPPAAVWRKLDARIKADAGARGSSAPGFSLRGVWSGAVIAAALLLVVGIFIGRGLVSTAPSAAPGYLAVMSSPQGKPLWLITVHPANRRIDMKALADNTPPIGKSYQLWMLPGSGKPVSLGLMNSTGSASETVTSEMIAALAHAKGLAISIEPAGGSPTGQPTGPVVYVAPVINT